MKLHTRVVRVLQLAVLAIAVFTISLWISTPTQLSHIVDVQHRSNDAPFNSEPESPLLVPGEIETELETGSRTISPPNLSKSNPSFHLIITGATRGAALCRTILSAAILQYPPPTLIGYHDPRDQRLREQQDTVYQNRKPHDDDMFGSDPDAVLLNDPKTDNAVGVAHMLSKNVPWLRKQDLVLVVDGGSTWFQLPSNILVHRFHTALSSSSAPVQEIMSDDEDDATEKDAAVVLGARYGCISYGSDSLCRSFKEVPASPVLPKVPDSHAVMGRVPAVRDVFGAAGLASMNGNATAHEAFASAFAQQVRERYAHRMQISRIVGRLASWIRAKSPFRASSSTSATSEPDDVIASTTHMVLDHPSELFMMESQAREVEFAIAAGGPQGSAGQPELMLQPPTGLPNDIRTAAAPFYQSSVERELDAHNTTSIPWDDTLDTLPDSLAWLDLPLASIETQPQSLLPRRPSRSIPVLLQGSVGADARRAWRKMWFFPWARALLRNHLRSLEGPRAARLAAMGGDEEWDTRGGLGGAWTSAGQWLDFGDVCRGFEAEIFDDDRGEWRNENGDEPYCFKSGQLYKGRGHCEPEHEGHHSEAKPWSKHHGGEHEHGHENGHGQEHEES